MSQPNFVLSASFMAEKNRNSVKKLRHNNLLCIEGIYITQTEIGNRLGVPLHAITRAMKAIKKTPDPVTWAYLERCANQYKEQMALAEA